MKVAIIILNYNSSTDCSKCIGYLKEQQGIEQEIVLVDNCSREDECQEVKKLIARFNAEEAAENCHVTFIANKHNTGYNAGNNVGLRYAASQGYDYALIANPDMEFPQQDYLVRLCRAMEERPDTAVVCSDIVGPAGDHQNPMKADGSWQTSWQWLPTLLGLRRGHERDWLDSWDESHYCAKAGGCCLMVRLSFMKEINYFDEYPFLYCEEAILAKQVAQAQKKIYYLSDAQALHRHIASAKGDPRPRFRQWRHSRLYYIRQYSGYSWWGKFMASLSMRVYMAVMIAGSTLKK